MFSEEWIEYNEIENVLEKYFNFKWFIIDDDENNKMINEVEKPEEWLVWNFIESDFKRKLLDLSDEVFESIKEKRKNEKLRLEMWIFYHLDKEEELNDRMIRELNLYF